LGKLYGLRRSENRAIKDSQDQYKTTINLSEVTMSTNQFVTAICMSSNDSDTPLSDDIASSYYL